MTVTGVLSSSPAEAKVVAALQAADGWVSVDAVWHACPGTRRRTVRHHLGRLVTAGYAAWCERIRVDDSGVWRYLDGEAYRWCASPEAGA